MEFIKHGVDIFIKQRNVELAKMQSKIYWDWVSVITDNTWREIKANGDSLDGAHLYAAGKTKFRHLAKLPANIFPIERTYHREWDKLEAFEKIETLIAKCAPEYTQSIIAQIEKLGAML